MMKKKENSILQETIMELQEQMSIEDLSDIREILTTTLDLVAPHRVIRKKENQLVNTKIEAIKKRRDRFLKKYRRSFNPEHLDMAKSFTKTLIKVVKKEARRVFQLKAV